MLGRMLLRFSARSRLPSVVQPFRSTRALAQPLVLPIRTYATPGRPKSVVGEPSRPVKRAVKKAAKKRADGTSPAEKKIAAKKRKPASKRAETPKQAAKRQETADKRAARDAARKAKAKERKVASQKKTKLEDLKTIALPDAPKRKAFGSAYRAFWSERMKGVQGTDLPMLAKETAIKWKNMTPADIEHYNHIQHTANEAAEAEYKRFIESHAPDAIRLANLARAQLRRHFPGQRLRWAELLDERRPRFPLSSYILFSADRQASGDFSNIKIPERAKLISKEWKALNQSEKEKYNRLQQKDLQRYVEEHTQVFGSPPASKADPVAAATAAAA